MQQCSQNETQSVLQHGISVRNHLFELLDYVDGKNLVRRWRLPEWLNEYKQELSARFGAGDRDRLNDFAVFHDCGKPYCRTVDSAGKQHFPKHSEVSYRVWMEMKGDEEVGQMILHEMLPHTMKASDIPEFVKRPDAIALLLTALSSIHSNASMFGGLDSVSFKIKFKQLDRRGKEICKILFGPKK